MGPFDAPHDFIISGIHRHIAVVPARSGRHRPVHAGHIHYNRRLVNQLGLKFGFGSDNRIHDIGPLFFKGNPQSGYFSLRLFFLPLQRIDPLVIFYPHLVHSHRVAVGRILDIQGGDAQQMANAAHRQHHVSDVDTEGTVHRTAFAGIAFRGSNLGCIFNKFGIDPALIF